MKDTQLLPGEYHTTYIFEDGKKYKCRVRHDGGNIHQTCKDIIPQIEEKKKKEVKSWEVDTVSHEEKLERIRQIQEKEEKKGFFGKIGDAVDDFLPF